MMFSLLQEMWFSRVDIPPEISSLSPVMDLEGRRKRTRKFADEDDGAVQTVGASTQAEIVVSEVRPTKKQRCCDNANQDGPHGQSYLLNMVPDEVVTHILSFCGSVEDRFALQTTCKTFQRISNDSDEILANIKLGGDVTGKGGIILEEDTPATASSKLTPFARAGNLEAIYMMGMIKSYCNHDVDKGISLLKLASKRGYIRATYTLGLILRDLSPRDARRYMNEAAELGYFPAVQEVLPARELKAEYGEPSAGDLCLYLDPVCLNRLLGRHYVNCPHLRDLSTSHCWNPLCGRWAFRIPRANAGNSDNRNRRFFTLAKNSRTPGAANPQISRMKMCSRCCRAKYCSKLCQVYDWRSGRHRVECPHL